MVQPDVRFRRSRRRGAALIFVMLFALGVAVLVTSLLSMSTTNVKGEFQDHQLKQLAQVVRVGMASALNEINRKRLEGNGAPDPDGCGYGALLRTGNSGAYAGVPVRTNGSTGRIIGYFRSEVRTQGTTRVVRVVAAYPDFTNPRQLAGAEMALTRGRPPFPANPLSLTGDLDAGGSDPPTFNVANSAKVIVNDSTYEVPAINVSTTAVYNQVKSNTFAGEFDVLSGADPDSPFTPATGANTITNAPAGILSENTMNQIAGNIDAYVANHNSVGENGTQSLITAITANGGTISTRRMTGNATLPNDPNAVYYVDAANLDEIKGKLTGSGTLVITTSGTTDKTLAVENGGELVWDGNIIVQSSSATIEFNVDGNVTVNGILCIQSKDQSGGDADLVLGHGGGQEGTLNVNGSLLILSDNSSDFVTPSGSGLNVTGTLVMMGEDMGLDLNGGSKLNVVGSMAIAVPSDGDNIGLKQVRFDGGEANFTWSRSDFDSSMDALGDFFDPNNQFLPMRRSGYWERQASGMLTEQNTLLAGPLPNTIGFGID